MAAQIARDLARTKDIQPKRSPAKRFPAAARADGLVSQDHRRRSQGHLHSCDGRESASRPEGKTARRYLSLRAPRRAWLQRPALLRWLEHGITRFPQPKREKTRSHHFGSTFRLRLPTGTGIVSVALPPKWRCA